MGFDSLFFEIIESHPLPLEYQGSSPTQRYETTSSRSRKEPVQPFDCFHINSAANFGNEWLVNLREYMEYLHALLYGRRRYLADPGRQWW